jgi:acylphosphatase
MSYINPMKARAKINFKGMVQGVYFRANTKKAARRLGVSGWVRNLEDGSVGAIFEGEKESIEQLIEWCKTEQPFAQVTLTDVEWERFRGEFREFVVKY